MKNKVIDSHLKALRLARRCTEDNMQELWSLAPTDYARNEQEAKQIVQNHQDTLAILDELIAEEERHEAESQA